MLFKTLLASHPDTELASFVVSGLSNGFHIGFRGPASTVISNNLPSAVAHSTHITNYLHSCCLDGQTGGPFSCQPVPVMRCSGLGVVPKKNGKLRVIHHLSAPENNSVNDFISREEYSLQYIRIDDAIAHILAIGPGALLTKLDIRNAFRLIPVHPDDWHLLGIHWQEEFYFEKVLPFGLRSSPFIFDKVATTIEWIIRVHFKIPALVHYLDDFLNVSPPCLSVASKQRDIIQSAFDLLQVPLALEKLEGPTTSLTFLGITLDTIRMEASLPTDKLSELRSLLEEYTVKHRIPAAKFASLLGKLSFAASVVVPGRTFMHRLWDLSKRFARVPQHYQITLSQESRLDILWWKVLLQGWNGKSLILYREDTPALDLGLFTDASGLIGWGAFYGKEGRWIQGRWEGEVSHYSIEYKELYAVVAACSTWGHLWSRLRIVLHCDNASVVACLNSGTSKSPAVMTLLRSLFLVCSKHNFAISAQHVAGKVNLIADALSRGLLQVFRQRAPAARAAPDTLVPPPIVT